MQWEEGVWDEVGQSPADMLSRPLLGLAVSARLGFSHGSLAVMGLLGGEWMVRLWQGKGRPGQTPQSWKTVLDSSLEPRASHHKADI